MNLQKSAAVLFAVAALAVVGFQLALAAGAPWGRFAMGGAYPGQFPPPLRVGAVVQAALIALFAAVVLSTAGLAFESIARRAPWAIWVVVAFSAVSLVLNLITRSSGERAIWAPVAVVMLVTSVVVALT